MKKYILILFSFCTFGVQAFPLNGGTVPACDGVNQIFISIINGLDGASNQIQSPDASLALHNIGITANSMLVDPESLVNDQNLPFYNAFSTDFSLRNVGDNIFTVIQHEYAYLGRINAFYVKYAPMYIAYTRVLNVECGKEVDTVFNRPV